MSIVDPLACGFVKVGAFISLTDSFGLKKKEEECKKVFTGNIFKEQFKMFNTSYKSFNISYKTFTDQFPKIVPNIRLIGKKSSKTKENVLSTFSVKEWENLKPSERNEHSLENCLGCLNNESFRETLKHFPVKGIVFKSKRKRM